MTTCKWTSVDECLTARERSVAGTRDVSPPCPDHDHHDDALYHEDGTLAACEACGIEWDGKTCGVDDCPCREFGDTPAPVDGAAG